jgi:hypothetical protein
MFSCFALSDSFSVVPRASGPVYMFYIAELILDSTVGQFSLSGPVFMLALPDSFSKVSEASDPFFMFCAEMR